MSSKFFKVIFAAVLSIGLIGQANASVIYFQEGTNYSDSDGTLWEYIGFFDLNAQSTLAPEDQKALTGLEAALALFPAAGDTVGDFAISAFITDSLINSPINPEGALGAITEAEIELEKLNSGNEYADVNNLAWYDIFQGELSINPEDTTANVVGGPTYDDGDSSAFVSDRSAAGVNLNYVFIRATDVPEPSTLAIFALALFGLGARRLKR
jgi:hypothetical protein